MKNILNNADHALVIYNLQCNHVWTLYTSYIDGLVQDCSNSSVLAMELLQSCTKPSMCINGLGHHVYSSAISALSHYLNQK